MHGLTAADSIMRQVEAEMVKNTGKTVKEVRVKVGRFLFPDLSQLTSAWKLIVQDTPLSTAEFKAELADGKDCKLTEVVYE